jgi:hypothetical protein
MGRIKTNLIELFIDKAVLAVAVIAALAILFIFVIGSPNAVEYDGKKVTPGKIDASIYNEALKLQEKLKEEPQDNNSYEPKAPLYLGLIKNSIKDVNTNINFPLPGYPTGTVIAANRIYQLPTIEQIENPSTAVVTMAAFVPTEELSDTLTYDKAETKPEPEDVDLVTVESSINAKQLYESFRTALAGKKIPDEWKIEEQYARPVFAKVELQRRTLLEDGSWSQWMEVPKIKTCHPKKTQLPVQVDEYGTQIAIAMEQFAKTEIRNEILQPPWYDNAIPTEKWLCPLLYNERQKKLDKEQAELKKQQLEAEKAKKLLEKTPRTRQPAARPTPTPTQPPLGGLGGIEGGGGGGTPGPAGGQPQTLPKQQPRPSPVPPRQQQQPRTKQTVPATAEKRQTLTEEQKFNELLLTEKTNPADLEKLVFWAHDDTTKPGEKYQYRIRIGVFNPIAGKPWFSQEQKDLQDQMVLFSSFSESTETIEIPNKLHFFATDIREVEKGYTVDKTVEVKVARYTLGNWVTKTFSVKNGEQIGTVINTAGTRLEKAGIQTESIDLATGNVMVDARRVTEWVGAGFLRAREFYELLYCKTGQAIATVPIKERYWPEEIAKVYKEIEQAEAAEPITLLTRAEAASGIRRTTETRSMSPESGPSSESKGRPGTYPGDMPPGGMPPTSERDK